MSVLSPAAALLLLLQANALALARPVTTPWDMTGAPRFMVTVDTPREASEVCIGPNLITTFIFDTSVGGFVLEERERFRQASLSEDGLLLSLLPSGELPPGNRLKLTVRFADGAPPTSMDFRLVVCPRAEPQVEVYRSPRPGDSYRLEAEQAEARFQQCQGELARERAEHDEPRGLSGLLALKQMGPGGVRDRNITRDTTLRPGEVFEVLRAVSYRAEGGEPGAPVVRLLVEVELSGSVPSGPYLLDLWDESGPRAVRISGVTFP